MGSINVIKEHGDVIMCVLTKWALFIDYVLVLAKLLLGTYLWCIFTREFYFIKQLPEFGKIHPSDFFFERTEQKTLL